MKIRCCIQTNNHKLSLKDVIIHSVGHELIKCLFCLMLRTLFFQIVFHFWSRVAKTEGNFKVVCRAERSKQLIDLNRLENDLIAIFLNLSVVLFCFLFDSCSKLVPLLCFTLFILMHKSFYTFILSVVAVLTGSEIKELLFGIFIIGFFQICTFFHLLK